MCGLIAQNFQHRLVTLLFSEQFGADFVVLVAVDDDVFRGGSHTMLYSAVAAKLSLLAAELSRRLGSGDAPPTGLHNKLIIKGDDSNGR